MAPAYETCGVCGAVLLWVNGQLTCTRRRDNLAAHLLGRGHEGAKPAIDMGVAVAGSGAHAQPDLNHLDLDQREGHT
jgi:hypothetical protein